MGGLGWVVLFGNHEREMLLRGRVFFLFVCCLFYSGRDISGHIMALTRSFVRPRGGGGQQAEREGEKREWNGLYAGRREGESGG